MPGTSWLADLFLDGLDSDLELRVEAEHSGTQLIFPAHSLVLKCTSRVFRAMLETGKFKEGQTGVVEMRFPGNEMDAVSFIRYIYTKDFSFHDVNGCIAMLQAGNLYEVTSLVEHCRDEIEEKLTPSLACGIIDLVKTYEDSELYDSCLSLMLRSAFLIFAIDLHLSLSQDTMQVLLKSDKLNVLDENQVIKALWDWGKARVCTKNELQMINPEQEISPLLDHVRWSLVDTADETSPWYDIAKSRNAESNETVVKRQCETKPSLIPFSSICDIETIIEEYCRLLYKGEKLQILGFSISRSVLLCGFEIRICTKEWLLDIQPNFDVLLNGVNLKEKSSWGFTLQCYSEKNYCFQVKCEFFKPELIDDSTYTTICIQDCDKPPTLKEILGYKLRKPNMGSSGNVNFIFDGSVSGVSLLNYFPKI